jgi:hypothetical protein
VCIWYARPDCRWLAPKLCAFSKFKQLLIGESDASSVPTYRYLEASVFLRDFSRYPLSVSVLAQRAMGLSVLAGLWCPSG